MLTTISLILSLAPTPEAAFENVKVPEGYSKQLIAAEPEVMDVVAFCFDDDGNIYIAESFRQENAVPDNRSSPFWLLDDIQSQNNEDRLRMYEYWADQRENGMAFYSEFEERIRKLEDTDGDGIPNGCDETQDGLRNILVPSCSEENITFVEKPFMDVLGVRLDRKGTTQASVDHRLARLKKPFGGLRKNFAAQAQ